MITEILKWVVILFGLFIVVVGLMMLFKPAKVRTTLRKAGSTNFTNYAEITIRLIPAIALILHSEYSKHPEAFMVFGWFMLVTSLILYVVPRKLHHKFSVKSADLLAPVYFQFISPFAFLLGGLIIYNAL